MASSTWNDTCSTPDTSALPTISVEVRPCMRTTRREQGNEQRNVDVRYRKLRLRPIEYKDNPPVYWGVSRARKTWEVICLSSSFVHVLWFSRSLCRAGDSSVNSGTNDCFLRRRQALSTPWRKKKIGFKHTTTSFVSHTDTAVTMLALLPPRGR